MQMDIEKCFIQETIEEAGTDVGGQEESEVREVFQRIIDNNTDLSFPDATASTIEDIAVLFFVAGRTYQVGSIPLRQYVERVKEYMDFLVQRSTS